MSESKPTAEVATAEKLNAHLKRRPSAAEIQHTNPNIMPYSTASAIQPAANDLEKKLAARPSKVDLVNQNLLDGSNQSAQMVQARYALERSQKEDALNQSLQKRPAAEDLVQRHILADQSIDPSIQAQVIALRNKQLRQSLASNLEKRPEYEELAKNANILQNQSVDPSIRSNAYDLEQKLKRRQSQAEVSQYFHEDAAKQSASIQPAAYALSQQLASRPSIQDIESKGLLEDKTAENTSASRYRRASQNLGQLFQQRPDEHTIPSHFFMESAHKDEKSASRENFRRTSVTVNNLLSSRPEDYELPSKYFMEPPKEVKQSKRRKSEEYNEFEYNFGRQFTVDRPSLHEIPSKYFQQPALADGAAGTMLKEKLRNRRSVADLKEAGIYQGDHVARSIAGVALDLEKKLGREVNLQDLMKAGISPEYIFGLQSRVLQPSANRISNFLENRVDINALQQRGILHKEATPAEKHARASQMINPVFMQRKDKSELDQKILTGGMNVSETMSNALKPAASSLDKQLRRRRDSQDLYNLGILKNDPSDYHTHPAMAKHKMEQERLEREKVLANNLLNRHTYAELANMNITYGNAYDNYSAQKAALEKNMKKRKLEDALHSRPSEVEIPSKYFQEPKRKRKRKKKRRQSKAMQDNVMLLGGMLENRPQPHEVPSNYYERAQDTTKAGMLKEQFKKRQSALDLHQRGILMGDYGTGLYAPVDLANTTAKETQRKDVSDALSNALQRRPTQNDLQGQGILYHNHDSVAPALQNAASSLETKLKRRPSVDQLANQNILKKLHMAPHLQRQAEDLRKAQLGKRLNRKLSLRPGKDDLINRGYMPEDSRLTPEQLAMQKQLEHNMRTHKLNDLIASRPKDFELSDKIFSEYMETRTVPRNRRQSEFMQGKQAELSNLLANKKGYMEVDSKVFTAPPKRKRRLSAANEHIANVLESKLMQRPEKEEINENMWITAKDVKGDRGRRVSYSMAKHQEMMNSMLSNKQNYDMLKESVFREPTAHETLAYHLSGRKTKEELLAQGILSQYDPRLAGSSMALENALARRPTLDQLQYRNILGSGYGHMDPSMAGQRNELEKRMKQERLNSRLQYRPTKEQLADKGILDDSGLAPRLHGAAFTLNQKLVSGSRRSRADLLYTGVIPHQHKELSRSLAPAAHDLEKKLKRRMSIDDVAKMGILDNRRDPAVYNTTKDLERRRKSKLIDNVLMNRPDRADLISRGIHPEHKVADALQGAAGAISRHLKRRPSQADVSHLMRGGNNTVSSRKHEETLEDFIATRPLPSDLKRRSILPGVPIDQNLEEYKWIENRSDMAELQRKIEESKKAAQQKADAAYAQKQQEVRGIDKKRMRRLSTTLDAHLRRRPDKDTLANRGLLDNSGLAPRLHPAALNLQMDLTQRMTKDELARMGIFGNQKNGTSHVIAPTAQSLSEKLRRRPTLTDMGNAGFLSDQYVQERESKADRRRRISNVLDLKLRNRPTKETLADRAILDDSFLAPRLHPAAIDLQSALINKMKYEELVARGYIAADQGVANALHSQVKSLEKKLGRRQSVAELQGTGIYQSQNLSRALAPAAAAVEKSLKRRPSVDILKQRGIMNEFDTNYMPASMINKAMAHQRQRKNQKLGDLLQKRPDRDDLGGVLGDSQFAHNELAHSLRGAGYDLAKKLQRRPSVDMLTQRNILRNQELPADMQRQAASLGFRQRKQSIANQLHGIQEKKRKHENLERMGLPTNIATTDHIAKVMEMNQMMFSEIKALSSQIQVLQMTCNQLLMDKQKMANSMETFVSSQHKEMQRMAEYITENMKTSAPVQAAPVHDQQAEAEIRGLKQEFSKAKEFFNQERTQIQQKEAALKNYMLEQEIQVVRLKGEYDVKIEGRPIGIRFEGIDNGRNLCVQGVLQKSAAEAYGVMPGDVVVRIRNRSVENQDAQETLNIFRAEQLPVIVRFRKHEAHTQLKDLWRRKREMIESSSGPPITRQPQPGATKKRRDSGLIHSSSDKYAQSELELMRKQMEAQIVNLKNNVGGGIDPIVRAFEEMDTNQNGDLNVEEFINGLYRIGLGEGLSDSQMIYAFKQMDDDGSGYIDYEEFEEFLKHSHADAILDLVQKHIRERIATLIMQKRNRDQRTASETVTNEAVAQQKRQAEERAAIKAAYDKSASGIQRHQSVDGNNPKAWIESLTEIDQMRVKQLALNIRQILDEAHSWQSAVREVKVHLPNLELEIAMKIYPRIKDRSSIDRKEITRATLHLLDVYHTQYKNTQDPANMRPVEKLVEASRRYSTTEAAQQHMQQMRARAHGGHQYEDESSSEDEQYDLDAFGDNGSAPMSPQQSMRQLQQQLQINANMPPEMLQMLAQQIQAQTPATPNENKSRMPNSSSAYADMRMDRPIINKNRRRRSKAQI